MTPNAKITIRPLVVADLRETLGMWSGIDGLGLNESDTYAALIRRKKHWPAPI